MGEAVLDEGFFGLHGIQAGGQRFGEGFVAVAVEFFGIRRLLFGVCECFAEVSFLFGERSFALVGVIDVGQRL